MGPHSLPVKTVGVRALKNRLSEYLRMVHAGESLAVTNRGVVVARLVPPAADSEDEEEAVQRIARAGGIRLSKPSRPDLYPPPPGLLSEDEIQEALDWTRDER